MPAFILELYRALTMPSGADGEFLSLRRKSHLLQAEWYTSLAQAGEEERKAERPRHDSVVINLHHR